MTAQHAQQLIDLARSVEFNLLHEHEWTSVKIHLFSPSNTSLSLPRPLISGFPRTRIYLHPDDQLEALAKESRGERAAETVEREWVLPSHIHEKWSLRRFAECFEAIDEEPPKDSSIGSASSLANTSSRDGVKRMLLASLNDDSTIVYYIVHDGIVKPRQN